MATATCVKNILFYSKYKKQNGVEFDMKLNRILPYPNFALLKLTSRMHFFSIIIAICHPISFLWFFFNALLITFLFFFRQIKKSISHLFFSFNNKEQINSFLNTNNH